MRYIVPQELKSKSMLTSWFSAAQFAFVLCFAAVAWILSFFVYSSLQTPYKVFSVAVGLILSLPSPVSPGKQIYQSVYYMIRVRRAVYKPVSLRKDSDADAIG